MKWYVHYYFTTYIESLRKFIYYKIYDSLIKNLKFQSESPITSEVNGLGFYLLCSLGFVFYALVEFAVIIALKRRYMRRKMVPSNLNKQKRSKISGLIPESQKHDSFGGLMKQLQNEMQESNAKEGFYFRNMDDDLEFLLKIDHHSFFGYFIAYGLFNCIYWIDMLLY